MLVIDAHTHAFPDFLAEKALTSLLELGDHAVEPCHNGTIDGLQREMDRSGVDVAVLCSIATAPGQTESIRIWSNKVRGPRIVPLPSVHPHNRDIPGIMRRLKQDGFLGIKLHPMFQGFRADSREAYPIYEAAAEHGLLITFHAGYDLAYLHDDAASPRRIAKVLDDFPGLRVLATHFGGWNAWADVYGLLAGRDLLLGTSFTFGYIDDELFWAILQRHGIDKILFGSDSPWQSQQGQIAAIKALGLSEEDRRKVLGKNAERIFLEERASSTDS